MPPLNAAPSGTGIGFLAGNTDPAIGGNASTTYFNTRPSRGTGTPDTAVWPGTLAVSSRGAVYFLDLDHGLVRIDPNTGNSQLVLRIDPSGPTGDGGPVGLATLKAPFSGVHRLSGSTPCSTTHRASVASSSTRTASHRPSRQSWAATPASSSHRSTTESSPTSFGIFCDYCPIVPLPNGDFYRLHQLPAPPAPAFACCGGITRVDWSTSSASPAAAWCRGTMDTPVDIPIDDCRMLPVAGLVDVSSGVLTSMTIQVSAFAGDTSPCAGFAEGLTIRRSERGDGRRPEPGRPAVHESYPTQRLDRAHGRQYWHSNYAQQVLRYDGTTFTSVLGNGSTATQKCADGTPASTCPAVSTAQFVTRAGELYWMSDGTVRTTDENLVVTLMGEPHSRAGETAPSLSTRFGAMSQVDLWRGCSVPGCFVPWDRLVLADVGNAAPARGFRRRERVHLAGNGWPAFPTDETATETSVALAPFTAFRHRSRQWRDLPASVSFPCQPRDRPPEPTARSRIRLGHLVECDRRAERDALLRGPPGTPGAELDLGNPYFSEWFLGGIVDDKLWMNFGVFDFNAPVSLPLPSPDDLRHRGQLPHELLRRQRLGECGAAVSERRATQHRRHRRPMVVTDRSASTMREPDPGRSAGCIRATGRSSITRSRSSRLSTGPSRPW